MKHKPISFILAVTCAMPLVAASSFAADKLERPPGPVTGDNPDIGIKYDADQGLNVTPFSAKLLGLKMVDAEEKEITTTVTLQSRIYDAGGSHAVASAWLAQADAKRLKIGQAVKMERGFAGAVSSVSTEINGQAEIVLSISDSKGELKTGKFLAGSVALPSDGEVVVVPKSAIIKSPEGAFAYVDNAGWTIRTQVEIGAEDGEFVEIIDGIYYGDLVVTEPVMTLWMAELQLLKTGKACTCAH